MILAGTAAALALSTVTATATFALVEERLTALPSGTAQTLVATDLDGDGRSDAIALGPATVHVLLQPRAPAPGGFEAALVQRLDVGRALVATADVDPAPGEEIVFADERGVRYYRLASPPAARGYAPEPITITADGLDFGPDEATRAAFLADLNRDGRADLVLPRRGRYEVRLQRAPGQWGEARRIPIEIGKTAAVGAARPGQTLAASFRVPALAFEDLNGDGREDIVVRDPGESRYYLQAADGTFPAEPSFALKLADFEDPPDGAEPEGILAALENLRFTSATIEEADLDGDGLRDFVVLTESRVVAFRGSRTGVDTAEPWQVLKFSDAIGNVLLFPVNVDARPDLLTVRLDLPSLPRLLAGLFVGFTVDVRVLAFLTQADGRISRKPDRSNTLHLEVPPILSILRNPKEYTKKFDRLKGLKWRGPPTAWADLDGDGHKEAVVFEGGTLRVRGLRPGEKPDLDAARAAAEKIKIELGRFRGSFEPGAIMPLLEEFVFNPERSTYNVDTLPETIERLVPLLAALAEGARKAVEGMPVIAEAKWKRGAKAVEARDMDADGRTDIVVRDEDGASVIWSRPPGAP